MRVIVTGGTGLIGRVLVADLVLQGYDVVVLSRNPGRATGFAPEVRTVEWDARTPEGWSHLVDGANAIINLAGESIAGGWWTASRKQRILQSRLNAANAVVAAISVAPHKPRVLIQASAVGYYGPHGAEALAEDAPPGTDWLSQVAVAWEAAVQSVEAMGVRRVIIRTGVVLSRTGGALPKMMLPFHFFVGGRIGNGRQSLPWIHIADEVAAIRFLLESKDARGPFNLTAPNPVTNREFSRTLGQVMRRPAWFPAPAFALRAVLGEMAAVVLTGQNALPKRLQALGFTFHFPHLSHALANVIDKPRTVSR